MKLTVCVGGNKTISGARLGAKLAQSLQVQGNEVNILAPKGKGVNCSNVSSKEYSGLTTAKSLASTFNKTHTSAVISIMNWRACEAAVIANCPFVYVEYENFKEDKVIKNKKEILQKALRVLVISNSSSSGKTLNKKIYSSNAIRIAEPAVWVEHFNNNKPACYKKENNILAVGSFTKDSGLDSLLKTWARLAPAHSTWHLTIVGDGTQKAAFSRFITKNHLEASTEIVSAQNGIHNYMHNADIFAYPSSTSASSDILLDAMASKLPCVALESSAATSLIKNGVNGVVVNANDKEPFTSALDDMMVNWGKRVSMAVQASKLKDQYSFDTFVKAVSEKLTK
jgi:Glycosyltransferase